MELRIRLIDAGTVPHLRSQTVYHGVASAKTEKTPDTIILVTPKDPYVCIGLHQELEKEVDLEFCNAYRIPVVRREVGGGAVYLDDGQLFTQWVFQPDRLPLRLEKRFELFTRPIVATYQAFGIHSHFRPVNDIQVAGKKIGGTGAAAIGNAEVLVGSFMFDFNFELMAKVLKATDERFRDKIYESLQQYMTTMQRELGTPPRRELVKELYVQKCEEVLGAQLVEGALTDVELLAMEDYDSKFASEAWLYQNGGLDRAGVKIHSDVWLYETTYKADGGMIRTMTRVRDNRIDDISISGDFTFHPHDKLRELEKTLVNARVDFGCLLEKVHNFYETARVHSPGVEPGDWARAIVAFKNHQKQGEAQLN